MAENYDVPNIQGLDTLPSRRIRDFFYETQDVPDENGNTVIHRYIECHVYYYRITPLLIGKATNLELKNKLGRTAFLHALVRLNWWVIGDLIDAGANVHTTDGSGCNALHYIAAMANSDTEGHMELTRSLEPLSCVLRFFQRFLEKGVNVNLKNNFRETPLMWAAGGHKVKIVTLLLKYGAKVHLKDALSRTCLHIASTPSEENEMAWNKPNSDIITELIRNGGCVNCFDEQGRTPLGCILRSGHRNRNYFARKFLTAACLAQWEIRHDFYILQNRILGGLRADDSLVEHVDACYKEIDRIRSFQLAERFNLCQFALRGVPDAEENVASEIKDAAWNILVRETFPLYHDFIFSHFQLDYLRQKLRELEIFTYSRGQRFSFIPDVNSRIALSMNINEIFNVFKAFS